MNQLQIDQRTGQRNQKAIGDAYGISQGPFGQPSIPGGGTPEMLEQYQNAQLQANDPQAYNRKLAEAAMKKQGPEDRITITTPNGGGLNPGGGIGGGVGLGIGGGGLGGGGGYPRQKKQQGPAGIFGGLKNNNPFG